MKGFPPPQSHYPFAFPSCLYFLHNWQSTQLITTVNINANVIERIENHILEGSHPDDVPAFTPKDSNQNHKVPRMIVTGTNAEERPTAEKTKSDAPPPGTPARDRHSKNPKLKADAALKDFTKAGLL